MRAITILARTPLPEPVSEKSCREQIVAAVRQVAAELRNTPAVCRKSYINPLVFAAWREGRLPVAMADASVELTPKRAEKIALAFLRREGRRRART